MIRIDRGPEPEALRDNRFQRLARAALAAEVWGGRLPDDYDFVGYDIARSTLHDAQHGKCAYCEQGARQSSQPTEHCRPKGGARRDLPSERRPKKNAVWDTGYWWLAWTWENLVFSCVTCNDPAHKSTYFPIDGAALTPMAFNLGAETPLLVDPMVDDPLLHIRWQPRNPNDPRNLWEWLPVPVGPKGKETIEVFRLRDLIVKVNSIIVNHVLVWIPAIERRLQSGQLGDVREAEELWGNLLQQSFADLTEFQAARWWALTYLQKEVPNPILDKLPPPPRPGRHASHRAPIVGLPPAPSGIPDRSWLRLLANEQIDQALIDLLTTPHDLTSLRALLCSPHSTYQPAESTLKTRLRELLKAGKVRRNPDGTYAAV